MYRIRLHGRGGQGVKTASRVLGSALFAEGFEVQDAPRYGAERRGAPIFAYVRASHSPIHERGVIRRPDLVLVADDSLVPVAAAGVLSGLERGCLLLIASPIPAEAWRERLASEAEVLCLPVTPEERGEQGLIGAACAGAAARLLGVVSRPSLEAAIRAELAPLGTTVVAQNLAAAQHGYEAFAARDGCVDEGDELPEVLPSPNWLELPFEPADLAAPDVFAGATSVEVRTGLWRTMRPVIDDDRCHRCSWICTTFCPDGAIDVDAEGAPRIDYDHCKGCLVCVAVCPPHAIRAIPEAVVAEEAPEATP